MKYHDHIRYLYDVERTINAGGIPAAPGPSAGITRDNGIANE
ncbi:MAG: hypothetical protein SFV15_13715 [Polyangiaceae bacterium]|nr:hypothetical protein [Polyangiaceae bacterium]